MNEQLTKQAQDFFNAAKDARIPDNVQAFAVESVAKSREAYNKLAAASKDGVKVVEDIMIAAHAGAKTIGDKVVQNAMVNTEAAFDAAQQMARARSLPEVAKLQADFMQQQFAAASNQARELIELSSKVARQTFETFNSAAAKSLDQMKRSA
jgi:phasin